MTEGPDRADPADAQRTSEQQVLEAVQHGQRAIVSAVGAWAKTVESMQIAYPRVPDQPRVPAPQDLVDQAFEFAEKMLAAQRELARSLLAAAAPPARAQGDARVTDEG